MRLNMQQIQILIDEHPELRRELERYYRRGFSQGAAAGAYAARAGASPTRLEQWRKRVYDWREGLACEYDVQYRTQWLRPEGLDEILKGGKS